jgi:hypothetical protein
VTPAPSTQTTSPRRGCSSGAIERLVAGREPQLDGRDDLVEVDRDRPPHRDRVVAIDERAIRGRDAPRAISASAEHM